ncbi:MAG TPA: DegT/DnrJ/EryC1/StrS family aminotransferase [Vicinamibacterales bacterium]|nr:DegT/DnrJ/EryC1/StrS family aminotransferase [Vicinamibacterales bacterium]
MTIGQAAEVSVPLLDLQAQYRPIRDEILAAIVRVCDSQRFILGPENAALETDLAGRLDTAHAIAVSSGTDALLVAMMALGIGPGAEVITPTYSFFATAGCASRLGATPVFVDVDPVTFNADPAAIAKAITPRTRAILPVHLFGLSADMTPIADIADRAGVPVIEDAAQAIGSRYQGRQVGAFGAVTCYSFFPSKNLGGFGEGGLVTTNDESLAREIRLLRNHGAEPKYFHHRIGGNFRLDELQAAVLRVKAPHVEAWTEARRRNAERYRELFDEFDLRDTLTLPVEPAGYRHIYNQFVIRGRARDALKAHLHGRRIGTEIYYPVPFHRQTCFASVAPRGVAFPIAEQAAETSLALPIYGELSAVQQRHVVASIAEFYATP